MFSPVNHATDRFRPTWLLKGVLLLALAPGHPQGHAGSPPSLVFGGNQDYAPMTYFRHGVPAGIVVDHVQALARKLDRPIEIRLMPWEDAQAQVGAGRISFIGPLAVTEQRKTRFDFSAPFIDLSVAIFIRRGASGIRSLADLNHLRVGAAVGSLAYQVGLTVPGMYLVPLKDDQTEDFQELSRGRVDALLADFWNGGFVLTELGIRDIQMVGGPVYATRACFAVTKGAQADLDLINAALGALERDGTLAGIRQKWQPKEIVVETREAIQLQRLRTVIAFLLVVAVAGAAWSVILWKQIARRRKAEGMALDTGAQLATVIESTQDLIMSVDQDYCVNFFNTAASEYFRITYGRGAFLGASPDQLMPADRAVLWRQFYRRAITEGPFQIAQELPNGQFLDLVINPIRQRGAGTGVAVFGRDITDVRKSRLDLEASEKRYRDIVNRAPIGIFTKSLDGPYGLTNPGLWTQFECASLEEFETRFGTVAQRWAQPERYADFTSRLLREQQVLGFEVEVLLPSGKRKWLLLHAFLNEAELRTISGFSVDITGLRLAERERLEALEHLHQAQKLTALGELAGGVAHDFNNALAGISGVVELLKYRGRTISDEKLDKYFRLIAEACRRGSDLTRNLLTFARKGNDQMQPLDLNQVLEDTVELLRRTMDPQIIITFDPLPGPASLQGNASMLGNALMNLGINASHAMPEGGGLGFRLRTRAVDADECRASAFDIHPGDYLEIEVADTGSGMPPEVLERIFEPFFTTKAAGKGTGLGLAQVQGTVLDHHGALEVASAVGVGTRFRLLLPAGTAPAAQPELLEAVRGTGTLLLVDDEELFVAAMTTLLTDLGYTVQTALNGAQAVERVLEDPGAFSVVILDLNMPIMGGRQAFEVLRRAAPEVPVLLVTAGAQAEDLAEMTKDGLAGVIRKPVSLAEFSRQIAAAIGRKEPPTAP
jgi:signal transduction histidine kinase/ABC-type amino acid transport substrate-binding protein/CheY-like chemotaxis protein